MIGSLLLLSQFSGVIFCGDAKCLQGGSDENCATLLCGVLAKHPSPAPSSENASNSSCHCLCHLLIDIPKATLQTEHLSATNLFAAEAQYLLSTPSRDIDHPPAA